MSSVPCRRIVMIELGLHAGSVQLTAAVHDSTFVPRAFRCPYALRMLNIPIRDHCTRRRASPESKREYTLHCRLVVGRPAEGPSRRNLVDEESSEATDCLRESIIDILDSCNNTGGYPAKKIA